MKKYFISLLFVISSIHALAEQGISDTEILVGMHTDLSGPASMIGKQSVDGANMRFEEFNSKGGAYGRTIKFIVEDHQYTVPRAVQAANKLLRRDKVAIMLGSLGTPMNNAVLTDQLQLNVPNLFPLTAARSMYEPFHRLKFTSGSTYYDQIRTGIKYLVENNNRENVCVLYEDTDFGQEIVDATEDQLEEMGMDLIERASAKPTDTDFTAQIKKLKNANCDLVAMGTIVRTTILPFIKSKEIDWTDVDFVTTSASYYNVVAEQPNGVMNGLYCLNSLVFPYYDTANQIEKEWWDKFKNIYGYDPNTGAAYGYIFADILIEAVERAGTDLNLDNLITSLETIKDYEDPLQTGSVTFSETRRQGTNISYFFQVQEERFKVISGPIAY
ncbi:MAG: branched-chain amino acid ABC transporter substrate-binding protein [Pelagibacteraceae bacterium]|nr:branched-chain amino acid ABC transporter substrate-binding protein [Pelagibacteraceae bacterium]|tara:strand:+ start:6050 stop:7207 length:1158 start_codon:yes stop_codon:yes gene_type:complete